MTDKPEAQDEVPMPRDYDEFLAGNTIDATFPDAKLFSLYGAEILIGDVKNALAYAETLRVERDKATRRADAWVKAARGLSRELGVADDDSNGSIHDWRHICSVLKMRLDRLASERRRVVEECAKVCDLMADEHQAASGDCLGQRNTEGALTRARQAQTASDLAAAIRALSESQQSAQETPDHSAPASTEMGMRLAGGSKSIPKNYWVGSMDSSAATMADALRGINDTIYAVGAPLGSERYFTIRSLAVEALIAAGEPVSKPD